MHYTLKKQRKGNKKYELIIIFVNIFLKFNIANFGNYSVSFAKMFLNYLKVER